MKSRALGVPYIISNEAAERFSFYGMKAILVVYMTQYLMGSNGLLDLMKDEEAKSYYHLFVSAVYFFPVLGAIISDGLLGKYRTIISFSLIYCLGPFALALTATRLGLLAGLALIALGSGGIKACVSAHVGDQFGASNQHLLPKVFSWFYFSVNFGSSFSTMYIPYLLKHYGPMYAFGLPGILMVLATWAFWSGRRKFIHIPPGGMAFVRETFSPTGLKSVAKLFIIYAFVAVFWALWDQTASAWVLQAKNMDLHFMGITWLPEQIQTANPILILLFIPLFSYVIYPAMDKVFPLTPLRKMSIGLFVTVTSFLVPAWIEKQISAGLHPNVGWQVLAYVLITAGEILVSITCLEFSYTQAPKKMKSLIMAVYYLSISLGNAFTAAVNVFIQNPDESVKLSGADYYLFFAGVMLITAIVFIFVALRYREERYIQEEQAIPRE